MRVIAFVIWAVMVLRAEDWPEFRGPTGQGHAKATDLAMEWSETQNVTWKVPVPGRGWSSPVVKDGRIWVTSAVEQRGGQSLRLLAYDLKSGGQLLDKEVVELADSPKQHKKNSYASPTPILDGDMVYVHFGLATAGVKTTGEVVWTQKMAYNWIHGNGGSPVLYRDVLIFSCDGADVQFVVGLDKRTGEVRWKTERPKGGQMAFSTPLVIETPKGDQVVSVGGHSAVAYDPLTGKELWVVQYGDGFSNVPRPVYAHGLVYLCTGFYKPEVLAVRPDGTGDITKTHVLWRVNRQVPLTPSPIIVEDLFYMVSDNGIFTAVEAKTGRILYQERVGGNYSASPLYADGRLYLWNEEGEATVIAPGREFRVLAKNRLDGQTMATPAVAEKALIIRTDTSLYRIEKH
ncbi:MAG: PQQ-binding-like beta-propeller repeat protein [Bryobacterales bacterium]|nr:PQQ-binding-like beta-propeller repeat protein [Bryobacterales bacterium]